MSYSSVRVRICWNMLSAIRSLITPTRAEPLGPGDADGLDADARIGANRGPHLLGQEGNELLGLRGALLPLDPGVDILGVLPEDHHVHLFRVLHRARRPFEVADRPDTGE